MWRRVICCRMLGIGMAWWACNAASAQPISNNPGVILEGTAGRSAYADDTGSVARREFRVRAGYRMCPYCAGFGRPFRLMPFISLGISDLAGLSHSASGSAAISSLDGGLAAVVDVSDTIDEDALMRAKKITYDGAKDTVTLEGGAEYYGAEVIVSAPKVVVHRKQKKAVASGPPNSVYFLVKPEGQKGIPVVQKSPAQPELPPGLSQPDDIDELRSAENLRKYPVVVTAAKLDYSYQKGAKKAVMTGEPKAIQQLRAGTWREVTAPRAEFEEEKETLNLFSSGEGKEVRMRNSAGDDFIALSVRMGTASGKETLSGKGVEGVAKVRDDEVPRPGGGGGGGG
ncbi:MAG: hypothetical protein ABIV13_06855 [Fimbriimonadales bacterium]